MGAGTHDEKDLGEDFSDIKSQRLTANRGKPFLFHQVIYVFALVSRADFEYVAKPHRHGQ